MFREHEWIVAAHDLTRHGIRAGTSGAIVYIAPRSVGYMVEFFREDGSTIDVVDVEPNEIQLAPAEVSVPVES